MQTSFTEAVSQNFPGHALKWYKANHHRFSHYQFSDVVTCFSPGGWPISLTDCTIYTGLIMTASQQPRTIRLSTKDPI